MGGLKKILTNKLWLPVAILGLVVINWMASQWHARIDLTNEKRFTLSAPTKKILKKLDGNINIRVFLKGASNSGFTKLSKSAEEILQEFREIAGTKFSYEFTDPEELVEGTNVSYVDTLASMGVSPLILNAQIKSGEQQLKVFPVAMAEYNGNTTLIGLYEGNSINLTAPEINSAEAMLEYNFSKAISQLTATTKPMIAYSVGNGEAVGPETYDIQNMLQYDDTLFMLNLHTAKFIPDTFNLLMIVKPTQPFTDDEKLKIDQYIMRGGKLLMFVDKLNAEMDSIKMNNEVTAYDRNLELNDLLFKYGIRINSDLVMDLQCDRLKIEVNGNGQTELLPWNYFPMLQTKSNHLINKNIGFVASRFANSIDTVEAAGITKVPLLSTSLNSRTISTPAIISLNENVVEAESEKFKKANIPVAYLLEGKFTSLYKNRVPQSLMDSLNAYGVPFFSECFSENKMIVVSDADIALNGFYKQQPLPMGVNPYSMINGRQSFPVANRTFFQNCIDYLINNNGLMQAKSKDYSLQFLDPKKIENEKTSWQVINIAVPVLLVCFFGVVYQWWRKRRYTKQLP